MSERQAASLVREFLQAGEYNDTLSAFEREHSAKGQGFVPLAAAASSTKTAADIRAALVRHFDRGERGQFFNLWDTHIDEAIRNSEQSVRLEFNASLHFAVFPVNKHVDPNMPKMPLATTLDVFKAFLETRGAVLAKSQEFLPFYALPYLPDPSNHPTFTALFTQGWLDDLRMQLVAFAAKHVRVVVPSRLSEVLAASDKQTHSEARLMKKQQQLQADYHNLLSITAEVVGTLAAAAQHQQQGLSHLRISPEYIASLVERLHAFRQANATGAAGKESSLGNAISPGPKFLNYERIKQALFDDVSTTGKAKMLLLHALRWRILLQPAPLQRRLVVKTYIDYDVFGFHSSQAALHLLSHGNVGVQEQAVKLFNVLSSYYAGRSYLALRYLSATVRALAGAAKTADRAPILLHALGALEKLSVLRAAQSQLIRGDMVRFIAGLLDEVDGGAAKGGGGSGGGVDGASGAQTASSALLTEATLIYACALLLNLVLRTAGRARAVACSTQLVPALVRLLEHDDALVRTYVHGVLFALQEVPSVHEQARALGVLELLRCLRGSAPEALHKQIDLLVIRLERDPEGQNLANDGASAESDDGEEEDVEQEVEEDDGGRVDEDSNPNQELPGVESEDAIGGVLLQQFEASDGRSQGKLVRPPNDKPSSRPSSSRSRKGSGGWTQRVRGPGGLALGAMPLLPSPDAISAPSAPLGPALGSGAPHSVPLASGGLFGGAAGVSSGVQYSSASNQGPTHVASKGPAPQQTNLPAPPQQHAHRPKLMPKEGPGALGSQELEAEFSTGFASRTKLARTPPV